MGVSSFDIYSQPLFNELKTSSLKKMPLKWKARIGYTSYRTTLQYANGIVFAPSNGKSTKSLKDNLDGVHLINGRTGEHENRLVIGEYGDRDVNGVAVSASKIVFGDDNNNIAAFDWSGKLLWINRARSDFEGAPTLLHINNDIVLDVIAATEDGTLYAFEGKTGEVVWDFKPAITPELAYPRDRSFMGSASVIDINKDNYKDVIIGNRNGLFYVFNGKDGQILWKHRATEPSGILSSPLVRGKTIHYVESYGYLHKLTIKGRSLEKIALSPQDYPQFVAMPMVNDKNTTVIGTTFYSQENGYWSLAQFKKEVFENVGKISSSAILANVDSSKDQEFIFITESGWLIILGEDGELKGKFKLIVGGEATPLIADVDGDSYLELLIALNDQYLYCYDLQSKGPVQWGQFRANPYNTGVENDLLDEDVVSIHSDYKKNLFLKQSNLNGFRYNDWFSQDINPYLISKKGIGHALLGMTLGQFKKKINKEMEFQETLLANGLKAIAVIFNSNVQYYLVFPQRVVIDDYSKIRMVITNNPKYKTSDGIYSNLRVTKVSSFLGTPTFSYNRDYPLEERLRFQKQPRWLVFTSYSQKKAGNYIVKSKFNATKKFNQGAKLQFIGVR
jgi:outer membrane protein assembly factor BamB